MKFIVTVLLLTAGTAQAQNPYGNAAGAFGQAFQQGVNQAYGVPNYNNYGVNDFQKQAYLDSLIRNQRLENQLLQQKVDSNLESWGSMEKVAPAQPVQQHRAPARPLNCYSVNIGGIVSTRCN